MGYKGAVRVFEINREAGGARELLLSRLLRRSLLELTLFHRPTEPDEPLFTITPSGSKATVAAWCALDQYIVTGHENGTLNLWDMVSQISFSVLAATYRRFVATTRTALRCTLST